MFRDRRATAQQIHFRRFDLVFAYVIEHAFRTKYNQTRKWNGKTKKKIKYKTNHSVFHLSFEFAAQKVSRSFVCFA